MGSTGTSALRQCTVVGIDKPGQYVQAFYNPAKIKIGKKVPWQGHASAQSDAEVLEFTGSKNRTLSVDLFFDGYEKQEDVSQHVGDLVEMTLATIPASGKGGKDGKAHRPHFVMLVWGDMPVFKGVIASIDTEYSMFLPTGKPVRATCSLSLTELDAVQMKKLDASAGESHRNDVVRNRAV